MNAIKGDTSIDFALLEYPTSGMDLSPVQLLMSRQLQSILLMMHSLLTPAINEGAVKGSSREAASVEVQGLYYHYQKEILGLAIHDDKLLQSKDTQIILHKKMRSIISCVETVSI